MCCIQLTSEAVRLRVGAEETHFGAIAESLKCNFFRDLHSLGSNSGDHRERVNRREDALFFSELVEAENARSPFAASANETRKRYASLYGFNESVFFRPAEKCINDARRPSVEFFSHVRLQEFPFHLSF